MNQNKARSNEGGGGGENAKKQSTRAMRITTRVRTDNKYTVVQEVENADF